MRITSSESAEIVKILEDKGYLNTFTGCFLKIDDIESIHFGRKNNLKILLIKLCRKMFESEQHKNYKTLEDNFISDINSFVFQVMIGSIKSEIIHPILATPIAKLSDFVSRGLDKIVTEVASTAEKGLRGIEEIIADNSNRLMEQQNKICVETNHFYLSGIGNELHQNEHIFDLNHDMSASLDDESNNRLEPLKIFDLSNTYQIQQEEDNSYLVYSSLGGILIGGASYTAYKSDFFIKPRKINGNLPRNSSFAGQHYPLSEALHKKYPNGVMFNRRGFPVFDPYIHIDKPSGKKFKVKIKLTTPKNDKRLATQLMGLSEKEFKALNLTWHHVEDSKTLIAIPKDLHAAVGHTGGSAIYKHRQAVWAKYRNYMFKSGKYLAKKMPIIGTAIGVASLIYSDDYSPMNIAYELVPYVDICIDSYDYVKMKFNEINSEN